MLRRLIASCLAGIIAIQAAGCGRLINGKTQTITITSMPEGATVIIKPEAEIEQVAASAGPGALLLQPVTIAAVTPARIELARTGKAYKVHLSKQGYESVTATISRRLSRWTYGNLLIPSVFAMMAGFATDRKSGGAFKLLPKEMNLTLSKSSPTVASSSRPLPRDLASLLSNPR